jgi:thioredoxin reductase
MKELVIIGAGPAGLAAAAYAIRKRIDFLLVSRDLGGKTNMSVTLADTKEHQVIRARELVQSFRNQVEYLSHVYRNDVVEAVDVESGEFSLSLRESGPVRTRAVVVATGTRPRPLGVNGESSFFGRGLGTSSVSYSHLLADKKAFLLGDTDRVLHSALELSAHVAMLYLLLEPSGTYRMDLTERLRGYENIEIIEDHEVVDFAGSDYAESATIESESGSRRVLEADAFFVERHPIPNSALVGSLVDCDPEGHIIADAGGATSCEGIYAAGDVTTTGLEQILAALGDGAKAVLSAYDYILTFD